LPFITAYAEGKTVQFKSPSDDDWQTVKYMNMLHLDSIYRIAPEPKLRPWRAEDVPVGAIAKDKDAEHVCRVLILGACERDSKILLSNIDDGTKSHSLQYALEVLEHSIDGGRTWLPCGIQ
jgi:hypothetical protein